MNSTNENTLTLFSSLGLKQKSRWLLHYLKVKYKTKERKRSLALASFVKNNGTIVDVGAHLGYLTKEFARAHNGSLQVIAFEPGDYCLSILRRITGKLSNVTIVPRALSDREGEIELKTPIKPSGLLGIGTSHIGNDDGVEYVPSIIRTIKLDDYVEENNIAGIDLLKVDVEGAEFQVLKGAEKTIQRFRPIWYLEVDATMTARMNYRPDELFQFLHGYGYLAYTMDNDGNLTPVEGYQGAGDYFFKVEGNQAKS